jgi:hypothetical protein
LRLIIGSACLHDRHIHGHRLIRGGFGAIAASL